MLFGIQKSLFQKLFIALLLFLLPTLFFRQYLIENKILLPSNLLVSYYPPWKYSPPPDYPNGPPNKPIGYDNLKLFYPYKKFTIEELKKGNIPFWNPYVFSGNFHLATYQSAVLYPFNLLFLILPMEDAWSIMVIIQPVLASIFSYLFLRSLRLSRTSSLFGSIVYAYSGWMISWWEESLVIVHSIVWLPLSLYGSNLIWNEKKNLGFILLIVSIVMSIFAGFLQMTIYLIMTLVTWNIYLMNIQYTITKLQTIPNNKYSIIKRLKNSLLNIGYWKLVIEKVKVHWKILCIFLLALFASFLLSAPQWLPGFEAYQLSPRGTTNVSFLFKDYLIPIQHLITLIAPDYWGNPGSYNYFEGVGFYHEKAIFIGVIPLIFSLIAIQKYIQQKLNKNIKKNYVFLGFWVLFVIVTLVLGIQSPIGWIWNYLQIPILSVAVPSRIFALFAFGISVLSAYGFSIFSESPKRRLIIFPLSLILVVLFSGFGYVFLMMKGQSTCNAVTELGQTLCSNEQLEYIGRVLLISKRNLYLPFILTGISTSLLLLWKKYPKLAISMLFLVTIFQFFYFSNKYTYFSERRFVYPDHVALVKLKELSGINRVWAYGNAYIEKNILSYYGIYSPEGYDALFPKEYGELLQGSATDGSYPNSLARTDADLKPMGENEIFVQNPSRLRLMQLLGVKYVLETIYGNDKHILTENTRFPESLFTKVWEDKGFRIWKYKRAMPRASIVPYFRKYKDQKQLYEYIFNPNFDPNQEVLLSDPHIQGNIIQNTPTDINQNNALILIYEPTYVEIQASSSHGGYLILSDQYSKDWKAFVNGKETKILKANYSFRAVPISPGESIVIMKYESRIWKWSLIIASCGFLLFGITIFTIGKRIEKSI